MVFAIILLLVVQAGCDLSLPEYTSNIVDVGIQQGGIERVTPEKIRKETYDSLKLFMTDAEIARVEPYYTENQEGICERNTESDEILDGMDDAFGMPMLILSALEESGQADMSQLKQALDAGMITREEMIAKRNEAEASFGDMSDSIIQQKANQMCIRDSPYAMDYLRYILIGAPYMTASLVLNNQLRFQGNAFYGMIGIVVGAVINIILDPVLIFGMGMGIAGAAVATIISQFISFLILLRICLKGPGIRIRWGNFRPDFHFFKEVFRGGFPSLCRQGLALSLIHI